jgi:hypothetical protein
VDLIGWVSGSDAEEHGLRQHNTPVVMSQAVPVSDLSPGEETRRASRQKLAEYTEIYDSSVIFGDECAT